jgi:HPr kinase/phosphorylase
MSSNASIGDILTSLSNRLQLDWQHREILLPENTSIYQNWAGLCQPDKKHLIEVIDHRHQHSLSEWLLQQTPAETWIACENANLPSLIQTATKHALNLITTPLPASQIIPALLAQFAEQLSEHTHKHGVFMRILGQGVLLTGANGAGKSSLALELIERQHRLVADDAPLFYRFPETRYIYGICPSLLRGFLHVRDLGTLHVGKLFGYQALAGVTSLELVIELHDTDQLMQQSPLSPYHRHQQLLGSEVPVIKLSTKGHRNLALLVETAVKNHILYMDGYDANQALADKLQQELENSTK